MKGSRLDSVMAEKGYSRSREKAKREILAGWVKVNGETVRDPSRKISPDDGIAVQRPGGLFVSRGGEKLARALAVFGINLDGRVAADLGASTGGFTDCMLKAGASMVYAVDVGYGQLDYSVRIDPRVVPMERRHVNSLVNEDFPRAVDFFAMDVSFISVLKTADRVRDLFGGIEGVILIKPQFESLPHEQKKGIVRKPGDHVAILRRVCGGLMERSYSILGLTHSPLKGPKGNIEFLAHVRSAPSVSVMNEESLAREIDNIVTEAHSALGISNSTED